MANPLHIKGSRTRVLNTFPTKTFGKDGDIVICRISGKGVFLCTKAGGMWYVANKMEELRKHDRASISNLKTNSLSINKLTNAEDNTDKILVSDIGIVKYRTSEQVANELGVVINDIDYKQSYCSLGQYTNKEDCEANNGTWYYSDNDSHDSISSTAENELLTVASSLGKLDAESTLLYDGSTLEIKRNTNFDDNWQTSAQTNLLKLSYDSDNYATFSVDSSGVTTIATTDSDGSLGTLILHADGRIHFDSLTGRYNFYFQESTDDYMQIRVTGSGATTIETIDAVGTGGHLTLDVDGNIFLEPAGGDTRFQLNATNYCNLHIDVTGATEISTVDSDGTVAHMTLAPNGDLVLDPDSQKTIINATDYLYFDGGGDTYISEVTADNLGIKVGGDYILTLSEYGTDGNEALFKTSCATFTRIEAIFSATTVISSGGTEDTDIDFRHSNKFRLEMTGDITTINLIFPKGSGNFTLVCTTNGDHDVSNWKAWEYDESAATTADVMWAGGSVPAFTSSGVDIVSFYWDAGEQQAYGVASLAFATP